jgi:filamentous hemagglutinin
MKSKSDQNLLDNAVSFAQAYGLRPGIAPTADQVAHLASDIVWMESQQVCLPDGSVESGALAGTLQGGGTATTVDSYNRQLHQTEAQKLELLKAGKSATEKHRLDAAARALAKFSNGVPTNDAQYAKLQALQNEGKGYSAELQLLKNTGEFLYSSFDRADDFITSRNEAWRRIGGAINLPAGSAGMFGGALVASGGAVSCPVSLGAGCGLAVVGVGVAGLSAQQASEGRAALWGPYASTEGARVVASFGTSTYPGEANPLRNAAVQGITFEAIVAAGKYGPTALSAAEAKIA